MEKNNENNQESEGLPIGVEPPFVPTEEHKKEKIDNAINLLNEMIKVRLAPSSIHGVGVFAMRDIKRGEKLYTDVIPHQFDVPYSEFHRLEPEIQELLLAEFPLIMDGSHFLHPCTRYAVYLNHSDTPNYDAKKDKALKKIKKGQEITENYRLITNCEKIFPFLVDGGTNVL